MVEGVLNLKSDVYMCRSCKLYNWNVNVFFQDSDGYDIEIVVCSEGIKIYRGTKRVNIFAW